jgi:hypothetical protein
MVKTVNEIGGENKKGYYREKLRESLTKLSGIYKLKQLAGLGYSDMQAKLERDNELTGM